MSLGSSDKDQILLHEELKSETKKCSDPDKAGEVDLGFQSLMAGQRVF